MNSRKLEALKKDKTPEGRAAYYFAVLENPGDFFGERRDEILDKLVEGFLDDLLGDGDAASAWIKAREACEAYMENEDEDEHEGWENPDSPKFGKLIALSDDQTTPEGRAAFYFAVLEDPDGWCDPHKRSSILERYAKDFLNDLLGAAAVRRAEDKASEACEAYTYDEDEDEDEDA